MGDPRLQITGTPTADELEFIRTRLEAFNEHDAGPAERQPLAVLLRLDGQLVAGLSGNTAWKWLYVQWLWIDEAQRGQGFARKLLAAAEKAAVERGCHSAHIDTFSPQALHVYQRAGYTIFGTLPDFPGGRSRSFLSKRLI